MISLCVKYYYIEKKMESKTIVEENNFINTLEKDGVKDEELFRRENNWASKQPEICNYG